MRSPDFAIRPVQVAEFSQVLNIINCAAGAYRGLIPEDCWRDPYMGVDELASETAANVSFFGARMHGELAGVMALQPVFNAEVIRHAYVLPAYQGRGVGAALLEHLKSRSTRPLLVGTWAAASWAIDFYLLHGFARPQETLEKLLLRTFWNISARQIEVSVALTLGAQDGDRLRSLCAEAQRMQQGTSPLDPGFA